MEADLHQHFHLDLVDLWRPGSGLTLRKLWVLINRMPTKSATATALNDGREPWTLAEYLASDNWVLLAKQLNDKAPDAHPWRQAELDRVEKSRTDSRRQKMLERQKRYSPSGGR